MTIKSDSINNLPHTDRSVWIVVWMIRRLSSLIIAPLWCNKVFIHRVLTFSNLSGEPLWLTFLWQSAEREKLLSMPSSSLWPQTWAKRKPASCFQRGAPLTPLPLLSIWWVCLLFCTELLGCLFPRIYEGPQKNSCFMEFMLETWIDSVHESRSNQDYFIYYVWMVATCSYFYWMNENQNIMYSITIIYTFYLEQEINRTSLTKAQI